MKVLYVSKALVVEAYRDKLDALARHAEVTAVVPARWPGDEGGRGDKRGDGRGDKCGRGGPGAGACGSEAAAATTAVREDGQADRMGYRLVRQPVRFAGHNHFHLYRRAPGLLGGARPHRAGRDAFPAGPRPDLVHIDEEPYSAVTYQLARLCRRAGVPSLFFAWQNLDKRLAPPFGALRSRVFDHVSGAIAGTRSAADVLRRAGYAGPLAVVPQFGIDPDRFRPDPAARGAARARIGVAGDTPVMGFGGRLVPEKGVHLLIDALHDLPGARLVVLGDGPERGRLEARARDLGVAARVSFVGPVPSTEMPAWLAGLDVLALPSLRTRRWVEQFGRILVEAMACGVPVIGSDAGEIPRVIGDAGRIVPEGDVAALAGVLRELIERPAARRDLAQRGRARVLERFTQAHVAERTVAFYREVLAAAGRGNAVGTGHGGAGS